MTATFSTYALEAMGSLWWCVLGAAAGIPWWDALEPVVDG